MSLQVTYRPISSLAPYARNARTHSDEQIAQIAASIEAFGWTNPILVDAQGGIVAGHGRLRAAQLLGMTEVPVILLAGITEAQRRALVLADNKLALNAGWDVELLASELADLNLADFDLALTGFDVPEIDYLFARRDENNQDGTEDEPPERITVPAHPRTNRGDVWLLGDHRIMCGDCRDSSDVDRLLRGARVNLAFTSPPYAQQRDYDASSGFVPVHPDAYVEWFAAVAGNVYRNLAPDGSWFVNIKASADGLDTSLYVFDLVIAHVRKWGWHFATEFCWERLGVPKHVTRRFKNQFEPIYQFTLNDWKMRPDAVRHPSDCVPIAGGKGVGPTTWKDEQGGGGEIFGAARRRKNGARQGDMVSMQGQNWAPGLFTQPGLAFPGNRLPTMSRTHEALGHQAAFPVGLPAFFIKAYTDEGDAVFDPFLGSGSTVIAAEQEGRAAYGMDISRAYVDVAVSRWQTLTGKSATRECDGVTFADAEIAAVAA